MPSRIWKNGYISFCHRKTARNTISRIQIFRGNMDYFAAYFITQPNSDPTRSWDEVSGDWCQTDRMMMMV